MSKYTNTFSFKKVADNAYSVNYRIVDEEGNVVAAQTDWLYQPYKRVFKNMNEVRNSLQCLFGARRITVWKLDGTLKNICTNPASDFKTKGELIRDFYARKRQEKPTVQPQPASSVVPNSDNEALYEVVNKNGVWTVIKHAEPLYTAEQAKTVLFQRIVNG